MLANWVKESVSAGGTGNLTLGGAASGFITCNAAFGTNVNFWYSIEDGTSREVGLGYLSASTTLVRSQVRETLVGGTLDRTSPTAINATTAAIVTVSANQQALLGAFGGNVFAAGGIPGMCSMNQMDETGGTQTILQNYLHQFPFWWVASKEVSQAGVWCSTAAAGSAVRLGIYTIASNGKPGTLLKEFTDAATLNTATTGAKIAVPTAPFWLPAGFYYAAVQAGTSSPNLKCPQYSPASIFLGVDGAGQKNGALYRSLAFGALPADESGQSYVEAGSTYRISMWLK